jgi:hypothetical protein
MAIAVLVVIVALNMIVNSSDNGSSDTQQLPDGCGISENHSESYTTKIAISSTMQITSVHYYNDLICSNGTTLLKWSKS